MRLRYRSFMMAALLAVAGLPLGAQVAARAVAPPRPVVNGQPAAFKIPIKALYPFERQCDDKLRSIGEPNTVDLLGATRGLYLDGYGAAFTAEIGLVSPPAIYPFRKTISNDDRARVHRQMIERLPKLRASMKEMVRSAAVSLSSMPENQQIVVAVRLYYMDWEDTSGLPGMITMKADRRSALAGNIQSEDQ